MTLGSNSSTLHLKLYMTGREEDHSKNMCHAAMETGQMNSSQKDFKKIHVMQGKGSSLKFLSHVLHT